MTKKEQLKWLINRIDELIDSIEKGGFVRPVEKTLRNIAKLEAGAWVEKVDHVQGLEAEIVLPEIGTKYRIFGFNRYNLVDSLKKFKVKLLISPAFKNIRPNSSPKL